MDDLIEKLKDLGFNTYEAKVYIALLKKHPATGYEVSKESGVPQARAYDTLKTLETRGVVISNDGKPTTYLPIAPDELLNRWERSFKSSIDFLRESLPNMTNETVEPILNLRGKDSVIKRVEEMITHAKHNIFIEIWKQDAQRFAPALRQAAERGIDIKVVGYNGVDFDFGQVYQHALSSDIEDSLGGRWLIMAVDDHEGIVGNLPTGEKIPKAVYTRNQGIVFVIKELVVHDLFLLDVEDTLSDEMEKAYGKNMLKLRQKVLGDGPMSMVYH